MERRSSPAAADERGRLQRRVTQTHQSCENETDPRGPPIPAPPQIIITQGSHAIVAIDLSTQIHGELHINSAHSPGESVGRSCRDKKRLPLSTVQSELTNGGVRPCTKPDPATDRRWSQMMFPALAPASVAAAAAVGATVNYAMSEPGEQLRRLAGRRETRREPPAVLGRCARVEKICR